MFALCVSPRVCVLCVPLRAYGTEGVPPVCANEGVCPMCAPAGVCSVCATDGVRPLCATEVCPVCVTEELRMYVMCAPRRVCSLCVCH